eukprot:GAHX01004177.1.p2 GENE.GAHX01004177.1~~GAHX01004177.1.p2  ORF type:complete len:76 (+),score=13.37 GAHX01004177.1:659-886(+)
MGESAQISDFKSVYCDNKNYHRIDELSNKNVLYVVAILTDVKKSNKLDDDKGFIMESIGALLKSDELKTNLKIRS